MINEIISGFFNILGAIISGLLSKYGIPFLHKNPLKEYKLIGHGNSISLASTLPDFSKREGSSYELINAVITILDKKIELSSTLVSRHSSGKEYVGTLKGKGTLNGDYGFLEYNGEYPDKNITWSGIMALKIPKVGKIKAYWITEDNFTNGLFLFGYVEFTRQ